MSQTAFIKKGAEFRHRSAFFNALLGPLHRRQLLTRRNIASRRCGSLLGTAWKFPNPLFTVAPEDRSKAILQRCERIENAHHFTSLVEQYPYGTFIADVEQTLNARQATLRVSP
ncbi:hypothetical protein BZM27_22665 [Paraburkholderia steynii]|uniref:Uncharacterized protein n=1 Tax=Paraburkholderia steynii TaxID=1245441 RepID=A0A4V2NH08_9BURK|nr:hypothetical protein BZM27_22665 [Paraburkholderia steynii]